MFEIGTANKVSGGSDRPRAVAAVIVREAGLDAARLRPPRRVSLAVLLLGVPNAFDAGGVASPAEAVLPTLVFLTLAGHVGEQVVFQHALCEEEGQSIKSVVPFPSSPVGSWEMGLQTPHKHLQDS